MNGILKRMMMLCVCFITLFATSNVVAQSNDVFYYKAVEIEEGEDIYISDIEIPDGYDNLELSEDYDHSVVYAEVLGNTRSTLGTLTIKITGKRGGGFTLVVGTVKEKDGTRTLKLQIDVTVKSKGN